MALATWEAAVFVRSTRMEMILFRFEVNISNGIQTLEWPWKFTD